MVTLAGSNGLITNDKYYCFSEYVSTGNVSMMLQHESLTLGAATGRTRAMTYNQKDFDSQTQQDLVEAFTKEGYKNTQLKLHLFVDQQLNIVRSMRRIKYTEDVRDSRYLKRSAKVVHALLPLMRDQKVVRDSSHECL